MTPQAPPLSFAPGPTRLHPLVPGELARMAAEGYLSESHRSAPVRREIARADEALRALLQVPADHRVLFLSSATEAMERTLQALLPGASGSDVPPRTLHLVNGAFASRFHRIAEGLGMKATAQVRPDGGAFRAAEVDLPQGTTLLALTQNETSTGARIPPDEVRALAEAARSRGALVAADLVTGWPTEPVSAGWLDAGFLSVQKGFGLPAGLGVLVVSPALLERARAGVEEGSAPGRPLGPGPFFHLPALAAAAERHETAATPNTLAIRLLARVAEACLARGEGALAREAEAAFHRWWGAMERLGLLPFVEDADLRSRTVAVVVRPEGSPVRDPEFLARLRARGFVVGDGYGRHKGAHLRVAHFPVHDAPAQEALLDALAELLAPGAS